MKRGWIQYLNFINVFSSCPESAEKQERGASWKKGLDGLKQGAVMREGRKGMELD